MRPRIYRFGPLFAAAALAGACALPAAAQDLRDPQLRTVQAHLDRGEADEALELLKKVMKRGQPSAEALLLRSTALIMNGDTAAGFDDLERALKVDPTLRQGWLNLAGLEIAEQHYDAAYADLLKAQELDPDDPDNHLNLGAVRALQGHLDEAAEHFARYLEGHPGSAEAAYLVACNYALGGFEEPAVKHLEEAVKLDERLRLRARSDDRFVGLQGEAYRKLLTTDVYVPPADAHTAAAAFKEPYRRQEPDLVYAVLDALRSHGVQYDPNVEANDDWALIWSPRLRIKLFTQKNGTGVVKITAPVDRFTPEEWDRTTREILRAVYGNLERATSGNR